MTRTPVLALLLLATASFAASCPGATGQAGDLAQVLCDVYCTLDAIIPIMAFTLFVLAGVAYGIGNFFGAEIRAKANAWAMNCITGAIISLLIIIFSNMIITSLLGSSYAAPQC